MARSFTSAGRSRKETTINDLAPWLTKCLDAEHFHNLTEVQVVFEEWGHQYNQARPHSPLGYQKPASVYWGT
jgi:transposase InsO family protein